MGLLRNDLEFPARLLVPEIATVLATLRLQKGCLIERMSGSGSTCFAIFADRESAALALRAILDTYPQWWSVSANLLGGPMPERLTIEESQ